MNSAINIDGLQKVYPGNPPVKALSHATLDIQDNEFFTLLGPSGCGKTTLLRLIARFEQPTQGKMKLFGESIAHLPPEQRPVNTVFQHYALFPHMSVQDNVAFGLRRLGKSKNEAGKVAQKMLDLVQLGEYGQRKPDQLSGGQQQRVALARALAPQPKVLLLDEPLSALDLKLRQSMRSELKRIQKETGITFVFVTHDQEEALTMSDRISLGVSWIDQSQSLYDSLESYTATNAWMCFRENHHGQLKPGLAADIVVLNGSIEQCEPTDIGDLGIAMTMCDGEITYDSGAL